MLFLGLGGMTAAIIAYVMYENKQKKLVNAKITDQEVLQIARNNQGKINVAVLCENTQLTAKEAKTKLKYLSETGALSMDWRNILSGADSYILKGTTNQMLGNIGKVLQENVSNGKSWKEILPQLAQAVFSPNTQKSIEQSPTISRDAQIISLAIENNNIISASLICVKLNLNIDEAQKKLEELRQKQVFISEIGENGGLLYRLLH
ncbi:MAG: hypothetical protein EAZ85_03815 [Bacteroidetes bacterium]|nr:MAG: hypothetical protein EAZ85_03815 [Bacteroidota bacterium]